MSSLHVRDDFYTARLRVYGLCFSLRLGYQISVPIEKQLCRMCMFILTMSVPYSGQRFALFEVLSIVGYLAFIARCWCLKQVVGKENSGFSMVL